MKNIAIIILVILGIGLLSSCKKEPKEPVLDMNLTNAAEITSPGNGSSIVLLESQADSIIKFTWTAADYNLDDLETVKYLLQMAKSGTGFANSIELVSTTNTYYETTVDAINTRLIKLGETGDTPVNYDFRVVSYINNTTDYTNANSQIATVEFTIFQDIIVVTPIYLMGSATEAGWDNTLALEMTYLDDGKFSITSTLTSGTDMFVKFISDLGAWAPQWGTDETGTSSGGPLVYRPTEDVTDPPGIPGPDVTGEYLIIADTANLTYTITLASEITVPPIYMLGSATEAGWDNANALEMAWVSGGKFSIVATLTSGNEVKFISDLGAWAPQWGTDETGTSSGGPLVYRPTEDITDPPAIPAPSTTGEYLIEADTAALMYTITSR